MELTEEEINEFEIAPEAGMAKGRIVTKAANFYYSDFKKSVAPFLKRDYDEDEWLCDFQVFLIVTGVAGVLDVEQWAEEFYEDDWVSAAQLVELLQQVLTSCQTKGVRWGLCNVVDNLKDTGYITWEEKDILKIYLANAIDYNFGLYAWPSGMAAVRIEWLECEIVKLKSKICSN